MVYRSESGPGFKEEAFRASPGAFKGMTDTQIGGSRTSFPTTRWSIVRLAARDLGALDFVVRVYWKPLYFFVRQKGYDNENAKDIVQGFLTLLLERKAFGLADPARGRFRSLLLVSLENYLKDRLKASGRGKRGGGQPLLSLDFDAGEREFAAGDDRIEPSTRVDRAWAHSLFAEGLKEIHAAPEHAAALKLYLAGEGYPLIARRTGLTEAAARTAVHRLLTQLRDILTRHLQSTSVRDGDVQEEIETFIALLRETGSIGSRR